MAKKKIDISNHVLVPKHVKVSQKEKERILKKFNITVEALPKISINDAAIAGLDAKDGDVIKVTRNSPTSGQIEFYRWVTDGE